MKTNTTRINIHLLKLSLLLLLAIVLIYSCKKKDDANPDTPGSGISGMGTAGGALQGTPFSLPSGVHMIGEPMGYDFGMTVCLEGGNGIFVNIAINLVNTSTDSIIFLPDGLTFSSLSDEYQNGILVKKQYLHVGIGDTCLVKISAFCLNLSRHASDGDARFAIGPITNASAMLELIDLLKNKDIDDADNTVQDLVWQITDFNGLTEEDRATISNLPNM